MGAAERNDFRKDVEKHVSLLILKHPREKSERAGQFEDQGT